tara:strand:- start:126 stop:569 length:444 start_codon:yes stop_codon:yes gene_type:complete
MAAKYYTINNMKDFCNGMRNMANAFVCELLGCDMPENELDEYVTLGMVREMVVYFARKGKKQKKGTKRKIADADVDLIIEVVADDIYQSMLSKMAAMDMVEVCFNTNTGSFSLYKKHIDEKGVRHFGEELGLGLSEIAWDEMEDEND